MDPVDVGRTARRLEPLHAMVYFSADGDRRYVEAGLEPDRMCYFAPRAAPMGAVSAGTVAATFFNFNPETIARSVPRAWSLVSPADLVALRFEIAGATLRTLLGDDVVSSPEVAEVAGLARRAAEAIRPEGRPLAAAHLDVGWPHDDHLVLWHALSILREHRGDGHIALLVGAGLSGLDALLLQTATGTGFVPEFARKSRGWSREQWAAGVADLQERGLLDPDAELALTPEATAMRAALEDETHRLGAAPWEAIGPDGMARMADAGGRLARAVQEAGAFPAEGVFAR